MQNEFDDPDESEWDEEEPYYDWDDPNWQEDWDDEADGSIDSPLGRDFDILFRSQENKKESVNASEKGD